MYFSLNIVRKFIRLRRIPRASPWYSIKRALSPFSQVGFTLVELVAVVVIIGILAGLMVPGVIRTRERTMNKQAEATLRIIRAAQIAYRRDTGIYWGGNCTGSINAINSNLSLDLVDDGQWEYWVCGDPPTNQEFSTYMKRNRGGYGRYMFIFEDNDTITCIPFPLGASCP